MGQAAFDRRLKFSDIRQSMATYDLVSLIGRRAEDLQGLVDALNGELVPASTARYNSEWAPRYLGRRTEETLPIEKTRLTAFRGRLGLLIEHSLASLMDDALRDDYGDRLRMSAEVANQFPDFYVRNRDAEPLLRIDFKVLHDESDEYSARITEPLTSLRATDDLLLYAAWHWETKQLYSTPIVFPAVSEAIVVPAVAMARERDINLGMRGGYVAPDGTPIANTGNRDTNYGKINRIVHKSRRNAPDLDPNVVAFLAFVVRNAPKVAPITD